MTKHLFWLTSLLEAEINVAVKRYRSGIEFRANRIHFNKRRQKKKYACQKSVSYDLSRKKNFFCSSYDRQEEKENMPNYKQSKQ